MVQAPGAARRAVAPERPSVAVDDQYVARVRVVGEQYAMARQRLRVRRIADGSLQREHEPPVGADFIDPAAVDLAHQHASAGRRSIAVDRRQVARGVVYADARMAVLADDPPVADE